MQRTVHTPDGRLLAVEDRGDPAGRPVFVHHGSPSSRRQGLYGSFVRDAAGHGLRLIGYDRPGYGESSPQPCRTVADCAANVAGGIDSMPAPAGAAAMLGGPYEFMLSCTQDALAPGSQGWWDDNRMFRPW